MNTKKPVVSIIMGSISDRDTMVKAEDALREFGIDYEVKVLSAHRTPEAVRKFSMTAKLRGIKVIIAAAGGAAHLAGIIAAHTTLPVIGVPMNTAPLKGIDSYLSILQMPAGIPVATVSIGSAGAKNAAVLAAEIIALNDKKVAAKMSAHKKSMAKAVCDANKSIQNKP